MGCNPIDTEVSPAHPERFIAFHRDDGSNLGYLAIDTTVGGVCGGGVRATPQISKLELCHLAKAMTRKYAFLGIPVEGAKAAVLTEYDDAHRQTDLADFGKQLRPLTRVYSPGKDMGIDHRDLRLIFSAAGLRARKTVIDSGFYTGFSVMVAADECAVHQGVELNGCTAAIEGFGSVGRWAARFLLNRGCRVDGASTRQGAVYNPQGLDVHELWRLRYRYGDQCIAQHDNAHHIQKEDLLRLPVDLLVPCARSWTIQLSNADRVSAPLIVPGANNPVTDAAIDRLAGRGVVFFPDFVANCGGVLGSMLESAFLSPPRILSLIDGRLRPKIRHLLRQAGDEGASVAHLANTMAENNMIRLRRGSGNLFRQVYPLAWRVYRSGLIPEAMVRRWAANYMQAVIR